MVMVMAMVMFDALLVLEGIRLIIFRQVQFMTKDPIVNSVKVSTLRSGIPYGKRVLLSLFGGHGVVLFREMQVPVLVCRCPVSVPPVDYGDVGVAEEGLTYDVEAVDCRS